MQILSGGELLLISHLNERQSASFSQTLPVVVAVSKLLTILIKSSTSELFPEIVIGLIASLKLIFIVLFFGLSSAPPLGVTLVSISSPPVKLFSLNTIAFVVALELSSILLPFVPACFAFILTTPLALLASTSEWLPNLLAIFSVVLAIVVPNLISFSDKSSSLAVEAAKAYLTLPIVSVSGFFSEVCLRSFYTFSWPAFFWCASRPRLIFSVA